MHISCFILTSHTPLPSPIHSASTSPPRHLQTHIHNHGYTNHHLPPSTLHRQPHRASWKLTSSLTDIARSRITFFRCAAILGPCFCSRSAFYTASADHRLLTYNFIYIYLVVLTVIEIQTRYTVKHSTLSLNSSLHVWVHKFNNKSTHGTFKQDLANEGIECCKLPYDFKVLWCL